MTKKEQIEEMASDMGYGCTKRDLYPSDAKEIAKALYLLGYRKLDKDSVVISKEEYDTLKQYKTDWLNSEKMHLQGELEYTEFELSCANEAYSRLYKLYDETTEKLKKYIEFNDNLIVENQKFKDKLIITSKETAKEILQAVDIESNGQTISITNHLRRKYGIEVEE